MSDKKVIFCGDMNKIVDIAKMFVNTINLVTINTTASTRYQENYVTKPDVVKTNLEVTKFEISPEKFKTIHK